MRGVFASSRVVNSGIRKGSGAFRSNLTVSVVIGKIFR